MSTLFKRGQHLANSASVFEFTEGHKPSLNEAAKPINAKSRPNEREAWKRARQIVLTD